MKEALAAVIDHGDIIASHIRPGEGVFTSLYNYFENQGIPYYDYRLLNAGNFVDDTRNILLQRPHVRAVIVDLDGSSIEADDVSTMAMLLRLLIPTEIQLIIGTHQKVPELPAKPAKRFHHVILN